MLKVTMQNDKPFPASREDLGKLRETAIDAAKDLKSTAAVHAEKARAQFNDLSGHVKEEGTAHLGQVQDSLSDVVNSARQYVLARPLASLGVAIGVGLLLGLSCRRCSRE